MDEHVACAARFFGVRSGGGRRDLRRDESCSGKPGLERDGSFDLAALAKASNDLGDEQLSAIGIDMRIEVYSRGVHVRAKVRATVYVDGAGNLKCGHNAARGEMETSDAVRRVGVAGNGIEEPHVEIAIDFRLPARMGEVIQRSRDLKHAILLPEAVCRELKAAQ